MEPWRWRRDPPADASPPRLLPARPLRAVFADDAARFLADLVQRMPRDRPAARSHHRHNNHPGFQRTAKKLRRLTLTMHELITRCAELAHKTDEIRRNLSEIFLELKATLIADGISMMLADRHVPLDTKGIAAMNAISRIAYMNDTADSARNAARAFKPTMGLGPNQLTWLRRNIDAFKHAEEQRYQLRQDAVRAARMAGLI